MREQAWIWRCEKCGHRWLAAGFFAPIQCARCRKRGWHTKTANDPPAAPAVARTSKPSSEPQPIMNAAMASFMAKSKPLPDDDEPGREMCAYREYSEQLGETVQCGLPAHSGKVRHAAWFTP